MVWISKTSTLASANDELTISNDDGKFLFLIANITGSSSGNIIADLNFNDDRTSSTNYNKKQSTDNGSATSSGTTGNDGIATTTAGNSSLEYFMMFDIVNIASKEKLIIGSSLDTQVDGDTSYLPTLYDIGGKWVNTSNKITKIDLDNAGTGDFDTESNLTVISDSGYFENIENGTIFEETDTNKAYIWSSSSETWIQL